MPQNALIWTVASVPDLDLLAAHIGGYLKPFKDVVHDQDLCGVHMSPDILPEFETEDENRQRQGGLRPVTAETSLQITCPRRRANHHKMLRQLQR